MGEEGEEKKRRREKSGKEEDEGERYGKNGIGRKKRRWSRR